MFFAKDIALQAAYAWMSHLPKPTNRFVISVGVIAENFHPLTWFPKKRADSNQGSEALLKREWLTNMIKQKTLTLAKCEKRAHHNRGNYSLVFNDCRLMCSSLIRSY